MPVQIHPFAVVGAILFAQGCSQSKVAVVTSSPIHPWVEKGQIVYQADGACVADANGKFLHRLPIDAVPGERIAVSLQRELAFAAAEPRGQSIFIAGPGDAHSIKLTEGFYDSEPDFSPEGAIYFCRSDSKDGPRRLCYLSANDHKVQEISKGFDDRDPQVSPDGKFILFCRTNPSSKSFARLMRAHADGSNVSDITPLSTFGVSSPTWSSKGDKILFTGGFQKGKSAIYTMSTDNSEPPFRLTNGQDFDCYNPVSSPDDSTVAFGASPSEQGVPHIGQVKADGAGFGMLITEPDPEPHHGVGFPSYVK